MTFPSVPEKNKKPGILYTTTREGVELPVIDCTHPAFALSWTAAEQAALVESFLGERPPFTRLPAALRRLLYGFFLRGSFLAEGIRRAEGTFLSGVDTCAMKLGPGSGARRGAAVQRSRSSALGELA